MQPYCLLFTGTSTPSKRQSIQACMDALDSGCEIYPLVEHIEHNVEEFPSRGPQRGRRRCCICALWTVTTIILGILCLSFFESNPRTWFNKRKAGGYLPACPDKSKSSASPRILNFTETAPRVIFHFGPRKTATSSIQATLSSISDLLKQDRFVYLGAAQESYESTFKKFLDECQSNPKHRQIPFPWKKDTFDCRKLSADWEQLMCEVADHHDNGISIIFSDEGIPRMEDRTEMGTTLQELDRLTASYKGNRHVAVTYREYTSWILSEYNERVKGSQNRPDRPSHLKYIRGFVEWFRREEWDEHLMEPMALERLENYKSIFDSIHIFNLHNMAYPEHGVVTSWLCEMLPWAKNVCESGKLNKLPSFSKAKSNSADVRLAAIRLAQRHLLGRQVLSLLPDWTREMLPRDLDRFLWNRQLDHIGLDTIERSSELVEHWMEHRETTLPITCLTEAELEMVWHHAVLRREAFVPEHDKENLELRMLFEQRVADNDFCEIDYDQIRRMSSFQRLWEADGSDFQ